MQLHDITSNQNQMVYYVLIKYTSQNIKMIETAYKTTFSNNKNSNLEVVAKLSTSEIHRESRDTSPKPDHVP